MNKPPVAMTLNDVWFYRNKVGQITSFNGDMVYMLVAVFGTNCYANCVVPAANVAKHGTFLYNLDDEEAKRKQLVAERHKRLGYVANS